MAIDLDTPDLLGSSPAVPASQRSITWLDAHGDTAYAEQGDEATALTLLTPTWFPTPDTTADEAKRWIDAHAGWALADDDEVYC